jgi:hypothetical protein
MAAKNGIIATKIAKKEGIKRLSDVRWFEDLQQLQREKWNSHKERKDRKEGRAKYSLLDVRQFEAHHVLPDLKFVATKVHQKAVLFSR